MQAIGKRSVSSVLLVCLNVAWFGTAVILAAAAALLAFGLFGGSQMVSVYFAGGGPNIEAGSHVHMAIPVSFTADERTLHVTAPTLGIASAELRNAQAELRFVPRGGAFFVANLLIAIGGMAVVLWILTQLRALFRALRDGQPFADANATRVRRIAWAVVVVELARAAVVYFENAYAMTHFVVDGLRFDSRPHVNLAIFNGLIILVIAEVFRAGTRLDEDQSLTV